MVHEGVLLESQSLRASVAERTDVLDKVKALSLLPDGSHVTTQMVADYFEVDERVMTWREFEDHIAGLCRRDGCISIANTSSNSDLSADLVGRTADGRTLVVQCKHSHRSGRSRAERCRSSSAWRGWSTRPTSHSS